METQPGDEYIRELAAFIRSNERGLAESGLASRHLQRHSSPSLFSWLSTTQSQPPVILRTDTHHLFYLFIRMEAIGLPVGSLDILINSPSRPLNYPNIFPNDKSDTLSLTSLRSSLSVVSSFSLGASWWTKSEALSVDSELKYIFSSFTKLPALYVGPPTKKAIQELVDDPPSHNAIPLEPFKNVQRLECEDIDPRTLLGWDRMSESLRSLKIKNCGLEDITVVFIGAVWDDKERRQGSASRNRLRVVPQQTVPAFDLPDHGSAETLSPSNSEAPEPTILTKSLSPLQWAFLKHLYLPDNSLTFFPPQLPPLLKSLTHLDLSSNLLVSIPTGLGELYNLVSLNLKDNLIDSVLGVYKNVGQILSLVLSYNRLESICGLERLLALERIDLRHNNLEESSEIGRLSVLPNIRELWTKGNPFVETEDTYRISCFEYFFKEGKDITIDGTTLTTYERRILQNRDSVPHPLPSTLVSSSAPVIAVEHPRQSSSTSRPDSPPSSPSPHLLPANIGGSNAPRRKKVARIVDFAGDALGGTDPPSNQTKVPCQDEAVAIITAPQPDNLAEQAKRKPRHNRHQTEYGSPSLPETDLNSLFKRPVYHKRTSLLASSATVASRADLRRARVSASVFEAPVIDTDDDAETYRKRIEVLKRDMGESWLKVYKQSQES